jgi:hypothetical protein
MIEDHFALLLPLAMALVQAVRQAFHGPEIEKALHRVAHRIDTVRHADRTGR